jgi:hypothetical protein
MSKKYTCSMMTSWDVSWTRPRWVSTFSEQEGLSGVHPSPFFLVGAMNSDEGVMRPQLLVTSGCALTSAESTTSISGLQLRTLGPAGTRTQRPSTRSSGPPKSSSEGASATRSAAVRLSKCPGPVRRTIAYLCISLRFDGDRADLALARTTHAIAAYNDADAVDSTHVAKDAEMVYALVLRATGV